MAIVLAWAGAFLAWMGSGFSSAPFWAAALLPPLAFSLGRLLSRRALLSLGFLGLLALAASSALAGKIFLGLGVLGCGLCAWDLADLKGEARTMRSRAVRWSAAVILSGVGLGIGFSFLRLSLNFWALLGGTALGWLALRLWLTELEKSHGAAAKGKRSSSEPMG